MKTLRHVRMCPQAGLECVEAVDGVQRAAVCVGADAAGGRGQICGQLHRREFAVETGIEEEGQRHAVGTRRGRQHTMDGRLEVTAGGDLEEFSDVDDEMPWERVDVDPTSVAFDLEAGAAGFGYSNVSAPTSLWLPTP